MRKRYGRPRGKVIEIRNENCRWFVFSRIKKGEGQGKEKCHANKSMMSKEN
jgi:hypothetical protein